VLIKLAEDGDASVRNMAAYSLGLVAQAGGADVAHEVLPALMKISQDGDRDLADRCWAAQSLGQVAKAGGAEVARELAPALIKLAQDSDPSVCNMVAYALGQVAQAGGAEVSLDLAPALAHLADQGSDEAAASLRLVHALVQPPVPAGAQ